MILLYGSPQGTIEGICIHSILGKFIFWSGSNQKQLSPKLTKGQHCFYINDDLRQTSYYDPIITKKVLG